MPSKLSVSDFKFGIELESNLSTSIVRDKVKMEKGWSYKNEHCGSEIISPPLKGYKGLLAVRRQLRNMWKNRKEIKFRNCGLHVHVDIQDMNLRQLRRLVLIAARFDQTIFCLMDGARWQNQYCQRVNYAERDIVAAKSLRDIQALQSRYDRYAGLNLAAFSKHGTAEFRYAVGSADWQLIYSLISMYLRMVAAAKTEMKIPKPKPVKSMQGRNITVKNARKTLDELEKNKDIFFDFLQIASGTRDSLNDMFDENVLSTTVGSAYRVEKAENIKFSMKRG